MDYTNLKNDQLDPIYHMVPWAHQVQIPNWFTTGSAFLAELMVVTNRLNDRQTDRQTTLLCFVAISCI